MSDSIAIQVADKIVALIQAASLSSVVTVSRQWIPRRSVEELDDQILVDVIPVGIDRQRLNRERFQRDSVSHVAVLCVPDSEDYGLVDLVREEIEDVMEEAAEFTVGGFRAAIMEVNTLTLYWSEKLREAGAFVAITEVRWRIV